MATPEEVDPPTRKLREAVTSSPRGRRAAAPDVERRRAAAPPSNGTRRAWRAAGHADAEIAAAAHRRPGVTRHRSRTWPRVIGRQNASPRSRKLAPRASPLPPPRPTLPRGARPATQAASPRPARRSSGQRRGPARQPWRRRGLARYRRARCNAAGAAAVVSDRAAARRPTAAALAAGSPAAAGIGARPGMPPRPGMPSRPACPVTAGQPGGYRPPAPATRSGGRRQIRGVPRTAVGPGAASRRRPSPRPSRWPKA